MVIKFTKLLLLFFIAINLACNLEKQKAIVPGYIAINDFDVSLDYATQGSNSKRITDCWVYVNEQSYGTYELPCKVPIIATGEVNLKIRAGIKRNGIGSSREAYPFYTDYELKQTIIADKLVEVKPVSGYTPYAHVAWLEDFENSGVAINTTASSTASLVITTAANKVLERYRSGYIALNATQNLFEAMSTQKYTLPKQGSAVYLEMNYSCTTELSVGIVSYDGGTEYKEALMTVTPTTIDANAPSWKKIYMYLTPLVSSHTATKDFKIYFAATKTESHVSDEILLDNIKLLHQ